MPAHKPMGPHPVLLAGCGLGVVLLGWGYLHPSVHLLWQLPTGLWLVVGSIGKMASR